MKNTHILIGVILLFLVTTSSSACEICGCSNSNFQIGLLPAFNKGFFGYRYSYSRFSSSVRNEPSEFSRDYYQTMELWGGYNVKRFQFMAFVPYVFSRKVSDDGETKTNGLGDVMFLVNYKILGSTTMSKNESTTIRHEVYFGGGIKLPTGVNKIDPLDPDFNIGDFNSQAGTGSVDYMINMTYNLLWNNSGIVTNGAYRINTPNSQDYRFGNRSYLNVAYFYTFTASGTKVKPNVGLNYQHNSINRFQGEEVENSNGYALNSTIGVNILRKKIGFNAMTFIPVSQNSYDGQTKLKSRFLVGVTFSI
jgi:hypothetical protein